MNIETLHTMSTHTHTHCIYKLIIFTLNPEGNYVKHKELCPAIIQSVLCRGPRGCGAIKRCAPGVPIGTGRAPGAGRRVPGAGGGGRIRSKPSPMDQIQEGRIRSRPSPADQIQEGRIRSRRGGSDPQRADQIQERPDRSTLRRIRCRHLGAGSRGQDCPKTLQDGATKAKVCRKMAPR